MKDGISINEALARASPDMIQPGLLLLDRKFFLKIEACFMELNGFGLKHALAYLLSMFFVFNIRYPAPHKYVYIFFETMAGFTQTSISSVTEKRFPAKIGFKEPSTSNM